MKQLKHFERWLSMRYYVTDADFIPLYSQPLDGYTELQAVNRAQREIGLLVKLYAGKASDYTSWFHIVDRNMNYIRELDIAI